MDCNKETLEAWENGGKDFDSLLADLNGGEQKTAPESRSIEKVTEFSRMRQEIRVKFFPAEYFKSFFVF